MNPPPAAPRVNAAEPAEPADHVAQPVSDHLTTGAGKALRRRTRGLRPPAHAGRGQQGSISVFAVVAVLAMMTSIGLVVDGGGRIRALERADALAAEAARAGGQQIDPGQAIEGGPVRVDPLAAANTARQYLAQAGATGTVTVVAGDRLRVVVTTHYRPVFLGLVGMGQQMDLTGTAEARLERGVDGTTP